MRLPPRHTVSSPRGLPAQRHLRGRKRGTADLPRGTQDSPAVPALCREQVPTAAHPQLRQPTWRLWTTSWASPVLGRLCAREPPFPLPAALGPGRPANLCRLFPAPCLLARDQFTRRHCLDAGGRKEGFGVSLRWLWAQELRHPLGRPARLCLAPRDSAARAHAEGTGWAQCVPSSSAWCCPLLCGSSQPCWPLETVSAEDPSRPLTGHRPLELQFGLSPWPTRCARAGL